MRRRPIAFSCGSDILAGMLDCADAHGMTGLLIVSGGNEVRAGAFAGSAQFAARLAAEAGVPVFRYDRRGIGDSEGENAGWRGSQDDIAAALAAFRSALPGMRRVVGFGVCDAASALMLYGAPLDGLVLVNPWTYETDDDAGHTPGALRRRYLAKLTDPRALWQLVSGAEAGGIIADCRSASGGICAVCGAGFCAGRTGRSRRGAIPVVVAQ